MYGVFAKNYKVILRTIIFCEIFRKITKMAKARFIKENIGFGVPKRPFPHFCDFSALLRHKTPQVRFGLRVRGFWVVGGVKKCKKCTFCEKVHSHDILPPEGRQ